MNRLLLILLATVTFAMGCAVVVPQVPDGTTRGRLPRSALSQLTLGMTLAEVEDKSGKPASSRAPSQLEVHRMFPGSEWDIAWIYHGEIVPTRFVRNSCQLYFNADRLVGWWFPYVTKDQYSQMTTQVKSGALTMSAIEKEWGYAARVARTPVGVDARYHLLQPDGTWYTDAIIIRTQGDQVLLMTLANF